VADLLSRVQAEDNRDGILVLTADNVSRTGGGEVALTTPLANGDCFEITVRDAQGNAASVTLHIALAAE
jgi:hypothetical protein